MGPVRVIVPIVGTVDRVGAARLCRTVGVLLDTGAVHLVTCDTSVAHVDLGLVDALARVAVATRRSGCALQVAGATADLEALVELVGLAAVLPTR